MQKVSIQITQISSDSIHFILSNCDVSLANALRRVMISQVPTMAVHMINIYENTSVLHDEFLNQRLALIPFMSQSVDKYKYTWECDCTELEGECQVCKVYFELNEYNPDNDVKEVTSLNIRAMYENAMFDEENRPVLPVEYRSKLHEDRVLGIPLVKLSQNQRINLRFDVQKGIGKMHSKWCPTTIATFHPQPDVQVNEAKMAALSLETKYDFKNCCPTGVFDVKNDVFEVVAPEKCIFCEECKKLEDEIKEVNLIQVGRKKDRFVFTVESSGVLPPVTIVKKSIQILRNKLKALESKII